MEINRKKTFILAPKRLVNLWTKKSITQVRGIGIRSEIKYLGCSIGYNEADTFKKIKKILNQRVG